MTTDKEEEVNEETMKKYWEEEFDPDDTRSMRGWVLLVSGVVISVVLAVVIVMLGVGMIG